MTYIHTEMNNYEEITHDIVRNWHTDGYSIILCNNKPRISKLVQKDLDDHDMTVYTEVTPEVIESILETARKK